MHPSLDEVGFLHIGEPNGFSEDNKPEDSQASKASSSSLVPEGMKCDVRNLYERRDGRNTTWTTQYPDDLEEPPENAESAQYALLLRNCKCYDGRKKLRLHSIVVQSPLLKKVLGSVLKGYPGVTTDLARLQFKAPFEPFVHRWMALKEARRTESNAETKQHLEILWKVLHEELSETIKERNDHIAHGVVTFPLIWTIFEPGSIVYSTDEGHDRAYRFTSGSIVSSACGDAYVMNTLYVDFDGEDFGHDSQRLKIPEFRGTARITDLSAFPFDFHPDKDALARKLVARGQLFETYKGYHYKSYEGVALRFTMFGPSRYSVNSRIIIDAFAHNLFNPNRKVSLDALSRTADDSDREIEYDYDDDDSERRRKRDAEVSTLTEDQHLISSPWLHGYSLKDKGWLLFSVDSVKENVWDDDAFDSLVAPPEQKELILAFAQSQAKHKDRFDDVIQGKGRGIIMLLSGPPGVGKTLTAESVAEVMKVPLYVMGAGDLGTDPTGVEEKLANIFEMNTRWNSVLLLDEADVFLEARSTHDLERNKLVSIFLRLLEYYEGILFLTTNRVENIDMAFESRIHLSLQYDELDVASRRYVWASFLHRIPSAARFSDEELDELAAKQMNGRQIKNVLKAAQLLACKQEADLAFTHVSTVLRLRASNSRTIGKLTNGAAV